MEVEDGNLQAHPIFRFSFRSFDTGHSTDLPVQRHRRFRGRTLLLGFSIVRKIVAGRLPTVGHSIVNRDRICSPRSTARRLARRQVRPKENSDSIMDTMGSSPTDLFLRRKLGSTDPRNVLLRNLNDRHSRRQCLRHYRRAQQENVDSSSLTNSYAGAIAPKSKRGLWLSIPQTATLVASFIAPYLGAYLYTFSPAYSFIVSITAMPVLGAYAIAKLKD